MAFEKETAAKQLREITECPICMNVFMDPRVLPCIHTFCLECLKRISGTAKKDPGDKLPCPLCRKEFLIPEDGINGVPKNLFLETLLQHKMGSVAIICDVCSASGSASASDEMKTGQIPTATMRCLECQDNFCDSCVKVHQFLKISRDHKLMKLGGDTETPRINRVQSVKFCSEHKKKPLEYYCADCRKIVCVSCFVERHKLHDCKDIATVDKDFRQAIENNARKISNYADEMLVMREIIEKRKVDFLKEIVAKENAIYRRNQELRAMIDRDTKLLLDELSTVKSIQLQKLDDEVEISDCNFKIMKGFEAYCIALILNGSPSDIYSSYDKLILRADDLEMDHNTFLAGPRNAIEVSFETTDFSEVKQRFNNNIVGIIHETSSLTQFESCAIAVVVNKTTTVSNGVVKINLHRANEITIQGQMPEVIQTCVVGAVYCNTMYVSGLGNNRNEIWKYNVASGWMECASLVQGRIRHGAAFINQVLYICGGFVEANKSVLKSVEAYNAITDKCTTVGKLVHCLQNSGNCVPFRGSLYIFGGSDKDNNWLNYVQAYNTKENACSVLSRQMPLCHYWKRVAL